MPLGMNRAVLTASVVLLCVECGPGMPDATTGGTTGGVTGGTTGSTTTGGTTGGCTGCLMGETCAGGQCQCDPSTCKGTYTCSPTNRCVINGCRIRGLQNEGATCIANGDCGCPLFCYNPDDAGAFGTCQRRCNGTTDCPLADTSCQVGLCQKNGCGGDAGNGVIGGPCDSLGQGDGTCVPHAVTANNGTMSMVGTCVQNGCATSMCSVTGTRTQAYALCAAGFACSGQAPNPGTCFLLCDRDAGTNCTDTQRCDVLASGNPFLAACVPSLPSDAGPNCVPPTALDAGSSMQDWHEPFSLVTLGPGGIVLSAVEVTTIDYQGYELDQDLQNYAGWIVGSYWLSVVGESYGVGRGTYVQHYTIPSTAPTMMTESDIETEIESLLGANGPLPPPDSNSLYIIYFPSTTTITGGTGTSCIDYGGYHSEDFSGTYDIPYAVIPTCGSDTSVVVSHELIEAATDPFVGSAPGYRLYDPGDAFYYVTGGEVGDLCAGIIGTFDNTYVAQRIWSNNLADAGAGSPCAPVPDGETYVNVTPLFTGIQPVNAGNTTFRLTGWSNNAVAAASWPISVKTINGTETMPALSADTVTDGQNVTMTIHFPITATSGEQTVVEVDSIDPQGNTDWWPMIFQVQ